MTPTLAPNDDVSVNVNLILLMGTIEIAITVDAVSEKEYICFLKCFFSLFLLILEILKGPCGVFFPLVVVLWRGSHFVCLLDVPKDCCIAHARLHA